MRDKTCRGREGRRALGGFLPFTASDVLPKGSARGRISGSRSAVSGDLSPSISFSGLSRKRRKAGDREKQKKKIQEKTMLMRCSGQWLRGQWASLCTTVCAVTPSLGEVRAAVRQLAMVIQDNRGHPHPCAL